VDGIPLTDEDRAILDLETASVAGHTCKVVLLGERAPGLEAVRASVAARLAAEPALRSRLGGPAEAPVWVDDERFDIAAHVVDAGADPCDEAALRREVARLFAERLDRSRPLWRIDLVARASGAALVWRIHHALADGTVAMRFADSVLWDVGPAPATGRRRAHADPPRRHNRLAAFVRHEVALGPEQSPFDGEIGSAREVAFASAPLRDLHDAAKRLAGATLNDAVLTAVSGGVRRWIEEHHGRLGHVRVKVPVSLHHAGDDAGNRDSFFTLELPLGEPDPVARLEAVRVATKARKDDHDAETLDELMHELARVSPGLERLCRRFEASPRAFALNVSNVPGPSGVMTVLGAPVQAVYSIAEIGRRHALRVAVVSAGGRLQFGFCADPEVVEGLPLLAGAVEADAMALVAAAG
jgi:hypothetical protein